MPKTHGDPKHGGFAVHPTDGDVIGVAATDGGLGGVRFVLSNGADYTCGQRDLTVRGLCTPGPHFCRTESPDLSAVLGGDRT